MTAIGWVLAMAGGTAAIVWGAELFAEHLASASERLRVTPFALAVLLAGAEPEELVTVATASARGVDGVAFGDVIGANVAIITVALGVAAFISPVPFSPRVRSYGVGGLAAAVLAGVMLWDGRVGTAEGAALVAGYVVFIAGIWLGERKPPALGEVAELEEDRPPGRRVGRDFALVLVGLASLSLGAVVLVEGVKRLSSVEETQTELGLTLVGFATAFELVVLAWSARRHGIPEAAVAAVIGSFAYNLTMSLGTGALVDPIEISDSSGIQGPFIFMVAALALILARTSFAGSAALGRRDALVLLVAYPLFVGVVLLS